MSYEKDDRILIVGLDGGTFRILSSLMEKGVMPYLGKLLSDDNAAVGPLQSTIPPITAPAWTSFMTGKNPGKHGLFSFVRGNPFDGKRGDGEGDISLEDSRYIDSYKIWHVMNQHGKRVGVLDLPLTFPPEPLDGFMISQLANWGTERFSTYPQSLKSEIVREFPDGSRRAMLDGVSISPLYLQFLIGSIKYKRAVDTWLAGSKQWDCLITVYEHVDVLQHYFWKYLDSEDPRYDVKEAGKLQDLFETFFGELDQAIADLVNIAGESATLVIMSDHGFGSAYKRVYINRALFAEGLLHLQEDQSHSGRALLRHILDVLNMSPDTVKKRFYQSFVGRHLKLSRRLRNYLRETVSASLSPSVDLAGSKAFFHYNNREGVFLNATNKAELEALSEQIVHFLRSLTDPETGHPVIQDVWSREEIYQGCHVPEAPDILVQAAESYVNVGDVTPGGIIEISPDALTGTHRPDGILIIHGPNIAKRRLDDARIVDIAPTLLYLQGLPVPEDMDGRILLDAFEPGFVRINPARYAAPPARGEVPSDGFYPDDGEQKVLERLKALGYMD